MTRYNDNDEALYPAHYDSTRVSFGGCKYFASPFTNDEVSDERCSWCDADCTVYLTDKHGRNPEYACGKHADQYFFGARIGKVVVCS